MGTMASLALLDHYHVYPLRLVCIVFKAGEHSAADNWKKQS